MLLAAGCSFVPPQTRQLETDWPQDLPRQAELTDVPFFAQEQYQCGPAALATVLQYQGTEATPESLKPLIYVPEKKGSFQHEVLAATRRFGLLAVKLEPRLEALFREIATGKPVLVFQNLGLEFWEKWHFAVAVGYDAEREEIILRSGTEKRHVTSFRTFEYTWRRGQQWALVIVPPDQVPVTATPLAYLAAASGLESTGDTKQALVGYHTASRQWPEQPLAWFGLGNSRYALKAYAGSEAALREAVRLEPENAQFWNNLAYALAAQNCTQQARTAIHCARELAPEDRAILDSEKELVEMKPASGQCKSVSCPRPAPQP